MTNPARNNGPYNDGSNSLARESKFALATQAILTIGVTGALAWLQNLDTSTWSGWWSFAAVGAVSSAIAFLTAYKTRNR